MDILFTIATTLFLSNLVSFAAGEHDRKYVYSSVMMQFWASIIMFITLILVVSIK